MIPKKIVVLGSTGSVGTQALAIIKKFPHLFQLVGISANQNVPVLLEQLREFKPGAVAVGSVAAAKEIKEKLKQEKGIVKKTTVLVGQEGICSLAAWQEAEVVLVAIAGAAGIRPVVSAIKGGKKIALANKECLVVGGLVINRLLEENQEAIIIPVDSEHSAIFQCLLGEEIKSVKNLILTCSGGSFLQTPIEDLAKVTVKEALNHPNWKMGGKITIDSATLMNKGLEVIEAHWLFGIPFSRIKVLIHPQSLVHSLVEFKDGCLKAQLGKPTMQVPIQLAFTYPARIANADIPKMNLNDFNRLTFLKPDLQKFPCLDLAYAAGRAGGILPAVMNAANEEAVSWFLAGRIKYLDIARVVSKVMEKTKNISDPDLETILAVDVETRQKANLILKKIK